MACNFFLAVVLLAAASASGLQVIHVYAPNQTQETNLSEDKPKQPSEPPLLYEAEVDLDGDRPAKVLVDNLSKTINSRIQFGDAVSKTYPFIGSLGEVSLTNCCISCFKPWG